jgi:LuxR family transcriptional regulator, maltose regulon positive regulatory protein
MNRNGDRERAGTGRGRRDIDLASPGGPLAITRERSIQGRLVRREALFERLSASPPGGVVFVCGPAGSGKTMLLRSWVEAEGLGERVAWVAVERGEEDAQRFWLSVIDALADAIDEDKEIGRVGPTPDFRGEAVIEGLLSGLDSLEEPIVLVIDDLHELHSPEALAWLEPFLTGTPAELHLVLASREEPQLGLHRLRLAGALTEIRGPDLPFSVAETGELLEASGIDLSDEAVALLHERTEGWGAGLRLAAISLAEHPDPERFVSEFSGSERNVAAYLVAEVLERQPPEARELLLRTSILDRVSGPLADYLTGGSCSERILQELENANAFVTSLDAGRTWFRYHHLFADFLCLELRRTDPASIEALHRKAAAWYEEHGYPVEAIRHAQSAREWSYAARLLGESYVGLILDGRLATVHRLLAAFPPEALAENAELPIALASARVFEGRIEDAASFVDLADRRSATVADGQRWRFELRLANVRLWVARLRGELSTALDAMETVEAALAAQPPGEMASSTELRATAFMNLGITELWALRIVDARGHLEEALALARQAERPYQEITCIAHLGLAAAFGGRTIPNGVELAEEAIAIAGAHGWRDDPVIAPALAIGGLELVWLGRFEEAERWLERAQQVLAPELEGMTEVVTQHAIGLLRFARAQLGEAVVAFRAAERLKARLSEDATAIDPRSGLLLAHAQMGDTAAAHAVLAELSDEERGRAAMRVGEAAVHLAEDSPEQALKVLAPVLEGAEDAVRLHTDSIEALLFDAVAREELGDTRAAAQSLERALDLAEPEGIVLPFALAPVRGLLERHPRHRTAHPTLLSEILDALSGSPAWPRGEAAQLPEELSDAELRVLRFLPGNLKAPEIAAELFVSPNTVRTHLRHIYSKLDAHSRREAVDRAREHGLIAPRGR